MERKVYDVSGRELAVGMQVAYHSPVVNRLKVGEIVELRTERVLLMDAHQNMTVLAFNQVSKVAL